MGSAAAGTTIDDGFENDRFNVSFAGHFVRYERVWSFPSWRPGKPNDSLTRPGDPADSATCMFVLDDAHNSLASWYDGPDGKLVGILICLTSCLNSWSRSSAACMTAFSPFEERSAISGIENTALHRSMMAKQAIIKA